MRAEAIAVATALTFLTRVPAARFASGDPGALSRAVRWFPAVGLLIGSVLAATLLLLREVAPIPVAVLVVIAGGLLLTGCFHEDGLADVADSAGAFTVDAKLAIMRDSRVGTYGVLALIVLVLARFALLSELAVGAWAPLVAALVAAHVLARWSSVALMAWLPYARAEAANRVVAQGVTRSRAVQAALVGGICLLPAALLLGAWALLAVLTAAATTALAGWWFRRTFGGITGDCLGAANVVVEVVVLATVVLVRAHVG